MSETATIKETKELLKFVIEMGEAFDKAYADKKIEISEMALLIAPLMQVGPAFEGLDKIGAELKDLSEAEAAELTAFVKEELDLQSDKVEEIIETALEVGVKLYGFVQLFKKEEVKEEAEA